MQTKSIQTKRVLHSALLVMLLSLAGMGKGYANYSFSAVCPTGQTLYYKITNSVYHYVQLTYPGQYDSNNYSGYSEPVGDIILPSTVTYNGVNYTVTSIGSSAFNRCRGLTGSLTIPNSVISIGDWAFQDCSGFTGSLTIPNSVTTIGVNAFHSCSGFTGSLTLPNLVTINNGVFSGCSGFTGNLIIPNSVRTIDAGAFKDCSGFTGDLVIPNSVTTIGGAAFSGCSGLTGSLSIPNSVTSIGDGAFYGCSGFIGELSIPNSVTSIGSDFSDLPGMHGAFEGCSGFTGVTIPYRVSKIGRQAFSGCSGLTSVTIPNSVTSIGRAAFSGCSGLMFVTIPNSVTSIGSGAFYNTGWYMAQPDGVLYLCGWCLGYKGQKPTGHLAFQEGTRCITELALYECNDLSSVSIPSSVQLIKTRAFADCNRLNEIYFNAKDCTIENNAWAGCTSITALFIGDLVEIIKTNMFSGFENLTTLSIGKSVKTIGYNAFADNPRLNMIYYNVEKDMEAATNVFYNCPNLTTIHIGPEVKEIGSNIFKGCNTVHFVVALGPTPAVLDAGAFSDIVDNSVLMVSCGKRVTYYSVWNMFPFNNIIEDCDTYGINVGAVGDGGTITPSVTEAQMGQEVQITITPNPGMVLVSIKVVNANDPTQIIPISPSGKAASTYSFTMPPFEVVVMATFTTANTSVEENTSVSVPASVYPNPTTGYVKVEAENIKQISISNMLGQVVFDSKVGDDAFEYDFSGQKAGIYLVRIETASGVAVKKVSVTR